MSAASNSDRPSMDCAQDGSEESRATRTQPPAQRRWTWSKKVEAVPRGPGAGKETDPLLRKIWAEEDAARAGTDDPLGLAVLNNKSISFTGSRSTRYSGNGAVHSHGPQTTQNNDVGEPDEEDENEDNRREGEGDDATYEPGARVYSRKQGRRAARRKKSPSPPPDLTPHEVYFWQHRTKASKSGADDSTITKKAAARKAQNGLPMLAHDEYHTQITNYKDCNAKAYQELYNIHTRSFPQWRFELQEGYSVCLYGYGSKRRLVKDFAGYLCSQGANVPKILIINGYDSRLNLRAALSALATLIFDCAHADLPAEMQGSSPVNIAAAIMERYTSISKESSALSSRPVYVFINSFDAAPLRRPAGLVPLFARLSSNTSIRLLCTCDTPHFPLLWGTETRDQYNWAYHDTTTFISYGPSEIVTVLDDVNELLTRNTRRVKGKEGVGFVLKSLPENAKNLYRVLLAEILAATIDAMDMNDEQPPDNGAMDRFSNIVFPDDDVVPDEEGGQFTNQLELPRQGPDEDQDEHEDHDEHGEPMVLDDLDTLTPRQRKSQSQNTRAPQTYQLVGIDYRFLYQKATEEFICSHDAGFRQLLKEFYDHDMLISKRDAAGGGGEILHVPWRRDECEMILEELMG